MSTPALNPLVGAIRGKYPGVYDDMDDAALTKAVLAKHPQYEDMARPATPIPGAPSTQPEMKGSYLGTLEGGPTDTQGAGSKVPQSIVHAPDELGEGIAGAAAIGAASPVISAVAPPVARVAARHPFLTSMAIGEARKIPYVGKFIPPYSEFLPFLRGGTPEVATPPEEAPIPQTSASEPPVMTPETNYVPSTNQIRQKTEGYAGIPSPGTRADRMDDRAIQQEQSQWLETQGQRAESEARRRAIAGSSTGVTKGDLTRAVRPTGASGRSDQPPVTNDLTPQWQAELDRIRALKAKKAGD